MRGSTEDYSIINILDLENIVGEVNLNNILSDFSCKINLEIEQFVRNKALDFARKKLAITYLVFNYQGELCAIFALANKVIQIENNNLSRRIKEKLARFSNLKIEASDFVVPAYLIAQFGKNDSIIKEKKIRGHKLMMYAVRQLKMIQHNIGGGIIFLECESNPKLLKFYRDNGFIEFDERFDKVNDVRYIQMISTF